MWPAGALALAAAVLVAGPAAATGPAGARRGVAPAPDGLTIPRDARQLIVVASPTADPAAPGYLATLRAYARSGPDAAWRPVFGPWPVETGDGHLRRARREGDGATPIGVFGIGGTLYGNAPDPGGLHEPYHRLVCGDWWDEDPASPRYNMFVHVRCGMTPGFAAGSEALWTETVAYPYFAVVRFNVDPIVRGAGAPGSGIFLHSWVGGATAGCVALERVRLLEVLRWLDPSADPVIAIGTDRDLSGIGTGV
ncbi:MAG TPA: L,D-transpeptidase family protein [Solirubrobacteraceae bacterium]|nr:L,D-transpeptidase family protein [Solirubrobacteraceae bacterium]